MAEYKIVVEKDYLVFACGHFITYSDSCETLHGHNYRARVELEGELDENGYVWDFVSIKRLMRLTLAVIGDLPLRPPDRLSSPSNQPTTSVRPRINQPFPVKLSIANSPVVTLR